MPKQKKEAVQVQAPEKTEKILDRCMPYTEKRRLMVREVLREECGRELSGSARANGQEFDWKEFNAQFREDYETATLKELLSYCSSLYGLRDIQEIRERRAAHKQLRARRIANAVKDDILDDDDDIDDLEL